MRDERDAILGGAQGHVWGGWPDLSLLRVAEPLRGKGYGKKLLEAAEDAARSRGCGGAFLPPFSFQARPFYENTGYEAVAGMPDYPAGHTYNILTEALA